MFSKKLTISLLLLAILAVAVFFRIYHVERPDVITDEALIAFRSVGLIDFFFSPYQTTPWEWFDPIPAWAKFSYHDHPPLVFLLQHFSFLIFGQTLFALRLPFVLAGIGTVYLLYLLGKKLFNRQLGLIAAVIIAVSSYHIWISRTGLQESIVIFLVLLSFYLFFEAIENSKHWCWGIAFGLALLAKYTAVIFAPIIFLYLFIYHKQLLKSKKIWLSFVLAGVIFSPVIYYNINLYQATGHFDLQLSYIFGQHVSQWQDLPGKEQIGSFSDRLKNLLPAITKGFLPLMSVLFFSGLAFCLYYVKNKKGEGYSKGLVFLFIVIGFYSLLFLVIGPSQRFVSMLTPYFILLVAFVIYQIPSRIRYSLLVVVMFIEIFFTWNTFFINTSVGQVNLTYSYLRKESINWGYSQLDGYIEGLLLGKIPELTFPTRYRFLEEIKVNSLGLGEAQGKEKQSIMLVYDDKFYDIATFWPFHRRLVYEGWPTISAQTFTEQGFEFWQEQGIKKVYFFKALPTLGLLNSFVENITTDEQVINSLPVYNLDKIKRPDGTEVIEVYFWQY